MSLPSQETAGSWLGRLVRDDQGVDLGTCVRVHLDNATEAVEWLVVESPDSGHAIVPVGGATEASGVVTVAFPAELVTAAPAASSLDRVSQQEEASLYAHYGMEYSTDLSPSGLPADVEPEEAEAAPAPEPTPVVPASTPVATQPATSQPREVTSVGSTTGQSKSENVRWALPAAGAAVALAAGVFGARRLRTSRPPSPAGRLRDTTRSVDVEGAGRAAGRIAGKAGSTAARGALVGAALGTMAAQRSAERAQQLGARVTADGPATARRLATRASRRGSKLASTTSRRGSKLASTTSQRGNKLASTTSRRGSATVAAVTSPVSDAAHTFTRSWRRAMALIKNAAVFGVGYVVGARAGRERYEQLKSKATEVMQRPETKQAKERLGSAVTDKLPSKGKSQSSGDYSKSTDFTDYSASTTPTYSGAADADLAPPVVIAEPSPTTLQDPLDRP